MNKLKLLEVYGDFWEEFRRLCRGAGAACKPDNDSKIEIETAASKGGDLVIKTFSYFPAWRYKALSPTEKVDIITRSRETYSRANDHMSRSSVQVLYLTSSIQTAKSLLALHYDFVLPIQSAHPVFHAQFGMADFSQKELEEVGFHGTIEPPPKGTLYSSVRIPTPCMGFGSVLLGLAADHLEPTIFRKVLELVRRTPLTSWNASCAALQNSLRDGQYLPSHHWYE